MAGNWEERKRSKAASAPWQSWEAKLPRGRVCKWYQGRKFCLFSLKKKKKIVLGHGKSGGGTAPKIL